MLLKWGPASTYAAIMKAAADIAHVVDDNDYDDEVLKRYWVVHNGIKYTWSQFCYGPDGDDLFRIVGSIESVRSGIVMRADMTACNYHAAFTLAATLD